METQVSKLIEKFKNGTLSDEEKLFFENWYDQLGNFTQVEYTQKVLKRDRKRIWKKLPGKVPSRKIWYYFAEVAAIILITGIYFFSDQLYTAKEKTQVNLSPASNKAILILADGRKISLTDVGNGTVAEQSGIKILKTKDGQLIYNTTASKDNKLLYNTVQTPRGGHYQIYLPDGTIVWLNAASSLTYATSFTALKERKVKLKGEAYFQVKKDKTKPFRVETDQQEVEVLGTHFNINSYYDEPNVKTTLLEGSIKVNYLKKNRLVEHRSQAAILLKPGQQSVWYGTDKIKIIPIDTSSVVAWKNGDFQFNGEDLKTVMRTIARWYDVQVNYQATIPEDLFIQGWVSRKSDLKSVLKMIERIGGVHFKIEERRITVTN